MGKQVLTFGDIEIETKIYCNKVDIEKVIVSNKVYFGEKNYKYIIGYLYNCHKVKLLHIMLPKRTY